MADVRMPDGQVVTNVPDDMSPDDLLKSYSSHLAAQPQPKEASVWDAMKKGFGQAFSRENLEDIARQSGPTATARMVAPIQLVAGAAKLPANVLNLAGVSQPLQAVNQANQLSKGMVQAGGAEGSLLPAAANLTGELGVGSGALNLLGKAAGPVEAAMPYVKPAIEAVRKSPFAQSTLGGAALGAAGSESNSPMEMLKEGLYGAGAGALGHGVITAAGHVMDPVLERFKKLKSLGLSDEELSKLSSGQFFGGIGQKLESMLQDLPFGGAKEYIQKGETVLDNAAAANAKAKDAELYAANRAFEDTHATGVKRVEANQNEQANLLDQNKQAHNTSMDAQTAAANKGMDYAQQDVINANRAKMAQEHAAADAKLDEHHENLKAQQKENESAAHIPFLNEALKPLGVEIPEGMSGTQAMKWAQDKVSESYKDALSNLKGIRITKEVSKNLDDLAENTHTPAKLEKYHSLFLNDIDELRNATSKGGWLNPEKWQDSLKDLTNRAYNASKSQDVYQQNYGNALRDLKENWMDLIEGKLGSETFKKTNTAHSLLQAPQAASAYVKNVAAGGEFSPKDLLNAIKGSVSEKRFAGGEAKMEDLAVKAHQNIMADRQALKNTIADNKQKLAEAKQKDIDAMEATHTQSNRNLAKQKDVNANFADEQKMAEANRVKAEKDKLARAAKDEKERLAKIEQEMKHKKKLDITEDKENFQSAINEAKDMAHPNQYIMKRLGYGVALGGGLGGTYWGHALGISPVGALGFTGAAYGLSRGIYNPVTQAGLKKLALLPRSEAVRQVGKILKEKAPLGGLSAVESFQQHRQNPIYNEESPDEENK